MINLAKITDTHFRDTPEGLKEHVSFLEALAQKIIDENVKALIHAGDWAYLDQVQLYKSMKIFREYIKIPVWLNK
jgi:DNA repair exonuclease SbcCD nuclease subunit